MKKRLLLSVFAAMTAVFTYAHEVGDYVYTYSQRMCVSSANLLTNGNFADATNGWTSAEGGAIDANAWSSEAGTGPNGENVLTSMGAAANGSLCQTLAVEVGKTYVVSFWVKGETSANTATAQAFINMDGSLTKVTTPDVFAPVNVISSITYAADWTEVVGVVAVSDTLSTHEGVPTLVINLTAMPENISVTNFAVNEANEVYDVRKLQRIVDQAKVLMNVPEFSGDQSELQGAIEVAEGGMSQNAFDDFSTGESVYEALKLAFDAFLDKSSVDLKGLIPGLDIPSLAGWGRGGTYKAEYKLNLQGGNWGHLTDDANIDALRSAIQLQYAHTATYNAFHEDLPAGKYFFAAEIRNANTTKTSWPTEPVFNLETTCTMGIGDVTKEVGPIAGEYYQWYYMIADVAEDGKVNFSMAWPGNGATGGAFFIRNTVARAFDMNINSSVEHLQAWKKYIAQWNAAVGGRNAVLAAWRNGNYPWDRQKLDDALTTWDPYFTAQAAKGWATDDGKDAGVASTDDLNDWALYQGVELYSEPDEEGNTKRLEYQVVRGYQNALNAVKEANKPFTDLATAIDAAKATRNQGANLTGDRDLYKDAILDAINTLKTVRDNTSDEKREADTATLEAALQALNQATADFLASVTNAPIVDIDFSNNFEEVVPGEGEGYYKIAGVAGEMHFGLANVQLDNTVADWNFALGFNGELNDVLHVGGSSYGTVTLPAELTDDDALKVSFDLWYGQLGKGFLDIDLLNAAGVRVAGFSYDCYNKSMSYNDFDNASGEGMNFKGKEKSNHDKSGGAASICTTALTNSFELNIDYKSGTVQGKMVNASNTVEGAAIPMPIPEDGDNKITSFRVGSSTYQKANNGASGRRCWFDNLKISKFSSVADIEEDITETPWASETAFPEHQNADGIQNVNANVMTNAIYNLNGMRVNKVQKGLYIMNGKKYVVK